MKKNRKGFSLVELLATIVILGIIALIIVPSILSTIESSRRDSFESSVQGLIEAASTYSGINGFESWPSTGYTIDYIIENNLFEAKNIDKFTGGVLSNIDGTITVYNLTDGEYYANGKRNSLTITNNALYEIDYLDFNDFSNWTSGNYYHSTGVLVSDSTRISLNHLVACKPSTTYKVNVSNASYVILIRLMDENNKFSSSIGAVNSGGTFTTTAKTASLAISLYSPSLGLNYAKFEALFATDFTITIVEQ